MSLNILITADPELPVPPKYYGGIERIIFELIEGLIEKGHNVVLLANKESNVNCKLEKYSGSSSSSILQTINNINKVSDLKSGTKFDLIHSFGRLAYMLRVLRSNIPKIQSYQREITTKNIKIAKLLRARNLTITACSNNCLNKANINEFNKLAIHNFVDLNKYTFAGEFDFSRPLVFLGRLDRIKGAHTAIKVAKLTNKKLIIAGNKTRENEKYFKEEIEIFCDGKNIKYIGPVDDIEKNKLLSDATALIFPIEWDEPFGIVMAEALACGTPVIAFKKGAVPEVINDGQNGFVCDNINDMVAAVNNIKKIDRKVCRNSVETRFSKKVIVDQYEKLYYSKINN